MSVFAEKQLIVITLWASTFVQITHFVILGGILAVMKWEAKAERAAGEIYLLVESDQRMHFRGKEDVRDVR